MGEEQSYTTISLPPTVLRACLSVTRWEDWPTTKMRCMARIFVANNERYVAPLIHPTYYGRGYAPKDHETLEFWRSTLRKAAASEHVTSAEAKRLVKRAERLEEWGNVNVVDRIAALATTLDKEGL